LSLLNVVTPEKKVTGTSSRREKLYAGLEPPSSCGHQGGTVNVEQEQWNCRAGQGINHITDRTEESRGREKSKPPLKRAQGRKNTVEEVQGRGEPGGKEKKIFQKQGSGLGLRESTRMKKGEKKVEKKHGEKKENKFKWTQSDLTKEGGGK